MRTRSFAPNPITAHGSADRLQCPANSAEGYSPYKAFRTVCCLPDQVLVKHPGQRLVKRHQVPVTLPLKASTKVSQRLVEAQSAAWSKLGQGLVKAWSKLGQGLRLGQSLVKA